MKLKHLNDVSSCACVIEKTIFHRLFGDVNGKSVSGIIYRLAGAGSRGKHRVPTRQIVTAAPVLIHDRFPLFRARE
ncbi:hypothetical protein [Achromobacter sp. ESBL13]|uniref:hypothetical protein n=1 Tax=Achromobacter sp. ESBL13 TaxID=3077328 RepID=UPI002FC9B438